MAANSQFSMAVHILVMLARSGGEMVKSGSIADSVNTNAVVIRRLLGQLGQANLVESQTGSAGGSRLSLSPEKITLADIYRAVCCGDVFALHPRTPNQDCPVGRNIEAVLCNLQKDVDRTVTDRLSRHTLASVLESVDHAGA